MLPNPITATGDHRNLFLPLVARTFPVVQDPIVQDPIDPARKSQVEEYPETAQRDFVPRGDASAQGSEVRK